MRPNEVLYAVIAIIGGYVMVSITYRILRSTFIRRRRRHRESHEQHPHPHSHIEVPNAEPDMTQIYIMGGRAFPSLPNTVPDTLPALPSFKATTKQMTETVCGICLDTLSDGDLSSGASCPHVFHTTCITSWLKKDSGRTCPVCRNSFLGEEEVVSAPSSASSIEPQRSAITARRLAYPVRYRPQLVHTAIQPPFIYVQTVREANVQGQS